MSPQQLVDMFSPLAALSDLPPLPALLQDALTSSPLQLGLGSAVLGILFHLSILRPLEIENFMYRLLGLVLISPTVLAGLLAISGLDIIEIALRTSIISASFLAGAIASILTYRAFWHPLRRFPGPFGARLTKFYSVKKALKKVQYHKEVEKMHEQYGDFIRTGPRELCIVRKSAAHLIYGPNSQCKKASWYVQTDADPKIASINMTRDKEGYRKRRKVWDRAFSTKMQNIYIPRVTSKTDLLLSQLASSSGNPVDATTWSSLLAFDIMGDAGVSKDFGGVARGEEHPAIAKIHEHMEILGIMSHVPWLLNMMSRIPGATAGYAPFFDFCANEIKGKQKRWQQDPDGEPKDIMSHLVKAFEEGDVGAPPSEAALHDDARVVIIAGSETTATTLANTLYFLAKHPHVYRKLQSQADAAFSDGWSYEKAKNLPYLDDIIHESLRLKPALLTGSYRETPPQGLQIDEVHIPGNTTVFCPTQLVQRDGRYWKQAEDFVPERFTERRDEMDTANAPWFPFTLGLHSCPGKHLAMISLRAAISKIALGFDVRFAEGEDGVSFDREAQETFTTSLGKLMLCFTKRT